MNCSAHDTVRVEGFMRTSRAESRYLTAYEIVKDITADFPHVIDVTASKDRFWRL
jgi:hypothetical protein